MFHLIRSAARSVVTSARALVARPASPNPSIEEVAAVANYLHFIGLEQVREWEKADAAGPKDRASLFQGGAAAAEALSNVLLGIATNDRRRAAETLKELVNGAIREGIVLV